MFIEVVTLDLLFPLREEMWTLIKHLILRTYVQQGTRPEKAIKRTQNPEKNGEIKCADFSVSLI